MRERGTGIPWGTLSPNFWWTGSYSLGDVEPAIQVLAYCEEVGAGGSGRVLVNNGRESSVITAGLPLELRDSCVVSTTVAVWIPSFAGPTLPPMVRASCDERGWRRQEGFEAGSRCDGPGVEAVEVCCSPEPLIVVVVETSSRLAMSVGVSAMVGKRRCSSSEDAEESLPGGLGVWGSSHPHLKAITLSLIHI